MLVFILIDLLSFLSDNNSASCKFNTIASHSSGSNSHSIATNVKAYKGKPTPDPDAQSISQTDAFNESFSNSISSNIKRGGSLYIVCERSQLKYLKASDLNKGN